MKYYIQFLSTKTPDSSPAFIVHFDSQRYLFNCSEGTQRLINENKIHLGKIKNLFFTRSIWENIGGLPGMVLTLADSGTKEFGIHGPRNLLKCFVGTRNFLQRSQVNFRVHEFLSSKEKYVDENLTIIPVPIFSSKTEVEEKISTPLSVNDDDDDDIKDNKNIFERKIKVVDNQINPNELNRKILKGMFSGKEMGHLKTSKIFENGVEISYTSELINNKKKKNESDSLSNDSKYQKNSFEDEETVSMSTSTSMSTSDIISTTTTTSIDTNNTDKNEDEDEDDFNLDDYRNVIVKQPLTPDYSLCYICQGHMVPGKFNPKKAKELGVIPGKQFGLLSKGECVTTSDGTIVRPEQVKEPDKKSSIFIVVDCPSQDHVSSLIQQDIFNDPNIIHQTKNIIHILGDHTILKNSSYLSWMNNFPEDCNHIIVCNNYCSEHINFLSNSYMQYKLHQVDQKSFPLLYFSNEKKESLKSSINSNFPKNIVSACNNLQIHIEPTERLDYSKVKENFNIQSIPEKITEKLKNNTDAIQKLRSNIDLWREKHPFSNFPTSSDVEIVTLGTGSALPSKYRNVSSTIILSKRNGNILLDAGEGTLGQISRHFGPEKTLKEILPRIKMIFISHIHADHHLGMMNLLSIMASLNRTSDNPLYIIAPEKFNIWLEEYAIIQDIGLHTFIKVVPSFFLFKKFVDNYTNYSELLNYLNMSNIETVPVMHVRGACAIVFDYKDCSLESSSSSKPIRIAYSGDCRPNREFIRAGMGADVLIHESTFESELDYEALKKFHCTINEACIVGRCMKVKFLLLTHFSQRYPKVPLFPVFNSNDDDNLLDLLYSPIFDVLPAIPYNSRSPRFMKGMNEVLSDLSSPATTTTVTLQSMTTTNDAPTNFNNVSPTSSSFHPPMLPPSSTVTQKNINITNESISSKNIISPTQLIPSSRESIMKIENLWKDMKSNNNEPMKIGMAVDHFHIRLGYDDHCMEWITEAMRLLIPDDEEDEGENEYSLDNEDTDNKKSKKYKNKNRNSSKDSNKNNKKIKINKESKNKEDDNNNNNNNNICNNSNSNSNKENYHPLQIII